MIHPELEMDKKNVSEDESVINYKSYIEWKYKLKTSEDIPNEEERKKINGEIL